MADEPNKSGEEENAPTEETNEELVEQETNEDPVQSPAEIVPEEKQVVQENPYIPEEQLAQEEPVAQNEPVPQAQPVSELATEQQEEPREEVMKVSDLQNTPAGDTDGETTDEEAGGESPQYAQQAKRTSTMSDIPFTDSAILQELQEADEEACRTAILIQNMRKSIDKFQMKKHLTKEDAEKLEMKQSELLKIHGVFEEITRRVQRLVGLADISSTQFKPSFREILEGVVPDASAPPAPCDAQPSAPPVEGEPCVTPAAGEPSVHVAGEPSAPVVGEPSAHLVGEPSVHSADHELDKATLVTPEQLATIPEHEVEGAEEDSDVEPCTSDDRLPKVIVCGVEDQMPRIIVCDEKKRAPMKPRKLCGYKNKDGLMETLTDRLSHSYGMQEKLATENADLEGRRYSLQEELYHKDNTVESLQKQINSLQNNMRLMKKENKVLSEHLEKLKPKQHKQSGGSSICPRLCPPTCSNNSGKMKQQYSTTTEDLEWQLNLVEEEVKKMQDDIIDVKNERIQLDNQRKLLKCAGSDCPNNRCPAIAGPNSRDAEKSLRELKEQYCQLKDDYKGKLTEVSVLRRDIDKHKEIAELAKEAQEVAEISAKVVADKLQQLEKDVRKSSGTKEQQMEAELQLSTARQRFRESQDELEEMRGLIQDQASQLEDYRNRYLLAQQQVEEQRRQIEVNEMDNERVAEQVTAEIQRVRNQFQERLQELAPLSDILKATQLKLHETQQLRGIAERNCEDLAREAQEARDKAQHYARQLDESRNSSSLSVEQHGNTQSRLEGMEKKLAALRDENMMQKTQLARSEEAATQSQVRLEEKLHEVAQLTSQLDTLREESARQVARTKERAETMKRSCMNQISELERQLAASRAAAQTAQKDRNEIRQRMQTQINNLNESFEQAQIRIRNLQGNVNFLKTSYSNIFANDNANPLMITDISPNCDCG